MPNTPEKSVTGDLCNFACVSNASIVDCSSATPGCTAGNILADNPESLWISGPGLPQRISISLQSLLSNKNCDSQQKSTVTLLRTVGVYCWHGYTSNPRRISLEVSSTGWPDSFKHSSFITVPEKRSGVYFAKLNPCIDLTATPFIRLVFLETFESSQCHNIVNSSTDSLRVYLNRLYLFSESRSVVREAFTNRMMSVAILNDQNPDSTKKNIDISPKCPGLLQTPKKFKGKINSNVNGKMFHKSHTNPLLKKILRNHIQEDFSITQIQQINTIECSNYSRDEKNNTKTKKVGNKINDQNKDPNPTSDPSRQHTSEENKKIFQSSLQKLQIEISKVENEENSITSNRIPDNSEEYTQQKHRYSRKHEKY